MANIPPTDLSSIDAAVMARLRAPFDCEFIPRRNVGPGRWRIHDANDDAIASVSGLEEGYARLIVQALNEHFARRAAREHPQRVTRPRRSGERAP
jgi:hypothetical protein